MRRETNHYKARQSLDPQEYPGIQPMCMDSCAEMCAQGLLGKEKTAVMSSDEIKDAKTQAFDLLDSITKAGALSCDYASLHVVLAATHCFDDNIMETVCEQNVNPIAKVEQSTLVLASTVFGTSTTEELISDGYECIRSAALPQLPAPAQHAPTADPRCAAAAPPAAAAAPPPPPPVAAPPPPPAAAPPPPPAADNGSEEAYLLASLIEDEMDSAGWSEHSVHAVTKTVRGGCLWDDFAEWWGRKTKNTGNVHAKLAENQLLEAIEKYLKLSRSEETTIRLVKMLRKSSRANSSSPRK